MNIALLVALPVTAGLVVTVVYIKVLARYTRVSKPVAATDAAIIARLNRKSLEREAEKILTAAVKG